MRILIVSQLYTPEVGAASSRVADLAKEWRAMGHDVTVLTGFPNYPMGRPFEVFDYGNRLFKREWINGVEVIRTYNWFSKPGSLVGRMLNSVSSLLSNSLYGILARRRFDVVIATSPQPFILIQGWIVARLHRVPFVAEVRDPWPEVVSIEGFFARPLPHKLLSAYVRKFYHLSDMLVGVAENYRDLFTNKYGVPVGKIAIVRNGCNEDLFYPGPKENSFRTRNKLEGKFLCSFVGNVGNFLRCETLVRAAYILRDDPDIVFVFVGEGAGLTRVRQVKEELNADNVLILGNLPREEVPDVLRASDVSIAHAMNHPYYMTCVGAKIWEIMGSGVPILVGFKGETQQIVEGARAGFAFQPENEEEMASLIVKIKDDPGLASQLGKNGRKYILSGFTRRQLASKYLDAMNSILGININ